MNNLMPEKTSIGERLALIARGQKVTQDNIAKQMGISRISVNRFFRGHTDLRATDFVRLLSILHIDLNSQLDALLLKGSSVCNSTEMN